jgi:hypothetical protein
VLPVPNDQRAVHEHVPDSRRQLMRLLERGMIRDRVRVEYRDVREETFAQ